MCVGRERQEGKKNKGIEYTFYAMFGTLSMSCLIYMGWDRGIVINILLLRQFLSHCICLYAFMNMF